MVRTETMYWLRSKRSGSDETFENVGELIDGEGGAWRAAEYLQERREDVAVVRSVTTWFAHGGFQVTSRLHGRLSAHVP